MEAARPLSARAAATRQRILDAALAEFALNGLAGARVDEIAARSGANKRMLYAHFGSKEEIAAFRAKEDLGVLLLSDEDKAVMKAYGAFGTKMLYGKEIEGVIRSTFVVDVDAQGRGTVSEAQYNVKATGHVDRLRRQLGL